MDRVVTLARTRDAFNPDQPRVTTKEIAPKEKP
jgi:hypothetical protein